MRPPRLVPRWYAATVVVFLLLVVAVMLPVSLVADGAGRWPLLLTALATLLVLVAATRALVLPRKRRVLDADADGTVRIESPPTIVWSLVGAWLLVVAAAVWWGVLAVVDPDQIEAPGATVVVVLGALGSLPDLARLLTGRLHRWGLTLTADGFTYRGYRTDESVQWSKVHGASVQLRKPAGVLIDRKGTGPDLVVPITAFDLPAEQIVEEIQDRLARRRR